MRLPPLVWMYLPIFGISVDLRLDVARELALDLLEVGADRLEDLRQGERRFFHGGSAVHETLSRRGTSAVESSPPCASRQVRRRGMPGAASASAVDDPRDVGRLVPLAAIRHRREKRAVGFGQQPIERHARAVSRSSAAFGNVTMPASEM